ncbi:VOC family protein [Natrarchaeobaculum aegyptiacum]|uniref:VOC domain-containing protein n=1 Tax=Natrarchaeobaculum aegyptiacum TaxID=745377 RepID=A0A2Z2HP13_9EURY|nr:VOC family protein [Natrarchaeobaculum aegyptiacum]ARS88729.1 hypothetical protein B1756_02465 [Natrarchaeobaculum aegyptiacum]
MPSSLSGHHVGLTVSDLETTVAFYRDVLGLEVLDRFEVSGQAFETVTELEGSSGRFVHLDAGDVRLELVEYEPAGAALEDSDLNQPGAAHVGLAVDDLESVYAGLPEDVETLSDPQTTASGTTLCFLRDPEGNLVELLEA